MKARTKFLKIYYKIPENSRNLIWFMGNNCYSLKNIRLEIMGDTPLSKKILKDMGFQDD